MPEKFEEKNEDEIDESTSSDEKENCPQDENAANESHTSVLLYEAENGTKYKKRKIARIIRYVRYNKKNDSENYYRERLMLFIPWRNEEKDLISGFETFEAHYKALKTSIESKSNEYEHHAEELELARQLMENEDNAYDQITPNAEQESREAEDEGIIEADKFVYFNPNRLVDQRHYDIGIELQSSCSVPPVETTGIMLQDDEYLTLLSGTKAAFGGSSVIAVGDLYQLKPVNDFLICLDLKEGASSLARNLWKELFTMYELVDIMRQKDDLDFAHLLNRLRLN